MIIRQAACMSALAAMLAAPAMAQNEVQEPPGVGVNAAQPAPSPAPPPPPPATQPAPPPATADPVAPAPPPADDPFLAEPFPEPGLNAFDDPMLDDPWANDVAFQQQDRGFPWGLLGLLGLIGLFGLIGRGGGRHEHRYYSERPGERYDLGRGETGPGPARTDDRPPPPTTP